MTPPSNANVKENKPRKDIITKPCIVELVRIKTTPVVKLPTLQTNQDLIALGNYFTRSKTRPKSVRKGRRLRNASTDIAYEGSAPSSDDPCNKKRKKSKPSPPAHGPTVSRVISQNKLTLKPTTRLPPMTVDKPREEPETADTDLVPGIKLTPTSDKKTVTKGKFSTRS